MRTSHEMHRNEPYIPPNILIMEDEFSIAKGLEMVLKEDGYSVALAMTGKDALDILNKKTIDLLVADLRLPDIDGMDVIKAVKEKRPETGVVVITGYASVPSAVNAMKLGTFDYLPKPFTDDEIKMAVKGALHEKQFVSSQPDIEPPAIEKVDKKEEERLIKKLEVTKVLNRAIEDLEFWRAMMEQGTQALKEYNLSPEAKAAIVSGDIEWIIKNVRKFPEKQLIFLLKRLEREAW